MSQSVQNNNDKTSEKVLRKTPPSLWKSIILIIIFTFGIVSLFGVVIFLLINGAQQIGLSTTGYIAIFVVISGVFAWLVKRISDIASAMSHIWFPEESNRPD
jgi:hypothetical protein